MPVLSAGVAATTAAVPAARTGTAGASATEATYPSRLSWKDIAGSPYSEATFRYFLGVERRRLARSGRPFLLLTVELEARSEVSDPMASSVARRLFATLGACLRETDLAGWCQHGRVAGAVLAECRPLSRMDIEQLVKRVRGVLQQQLPVAVASRLRVRMEQHSTIDNMEVESPVLSG